MESVLTGRMGKDAFHSVPDFSPVRLNDTRVSGASPAANSPAGLRAKVGRVTPCAPLTRSQTRRAQNDASYPEVQSAARHEDPSPWPSPRPTGRGDSTRSVVYPKVSSAQGRCGKRPYQAWVCWIAVWLASLSFGELLAAQTICQQFEKDPILNGLFEQLTANTESRFTYDDVAHNLRAVLDVDASPAYYLSKPFPPIDDLADASFSVRFRVETIDAANLPEVFVGFGTTNHIGANGHGAGFGLSTTNGLPIVSAAFEVQSLSGETNSFRGRQILLSEGVDYLAVTTYRSQKRELALEVYDVGATTNLHGYSTVTLPDNRQFRVDRLGLENNGFKTRDFTDGSITLTVDDLCAPASYRNRVSLPDAMPVTEGNPGAVVEAIFELALAPGSSQEISVHYATADGTAVAGKDYVPADGVATFGPGVR
ncbi:MAG: hypothetical protein L0Z50_04630, partial [Verrucomicrobiales bacterium]|nr:hypothetical protein [Verrucomicrobiales bacterium]